VVLLRCRHHLIQEGGAVCQVVRQEEGQDQDQDQGEPRLHTLEGGAHRHTLEGGRRRHTLEGGGRRHTLAREARAAAAVGHPLRMGRRWDPRQAMEAGKEARHHRIIRPSRAPTVALIAWGRAFLATRTRTRRPRIYHRCRPRIQGRHRSRRMRRTCRTITTRQQHLVLTVLTVLPVLPAPGVLLLRMLQVEYPTSRMDQVNTPKKKRPR
jgi:hypothetical protein